MKFVYQYRTPDNRQHEGTVSASDRDAAYAKLKAEGIKPGRLSDAPGFFNKLFGKGKRWLAIGVLSVGCLALAWVVLREEPKPEAVRYVRDDGTVVPISRRQIWGDGGVVDELAKRGWRDLFPNQAECVLAHFARPGVQVKIPLNPAFLEKSFVEALKRPLRAEAAELDECKQMKCIVEGMKDELRDYLKDGGDLPHYLQRLVERQNAEIALYNRESTALDQLAKAKSTTLLRSWREANCRLRAVGLPILPMPQKGVN